LRNRNSHPQVWRLCRDSFCPWRPAGCVDVRALGEEARLVRKPGFSDVLALFSAGIRAFKRTAACPRGFPYRHRTLLGARRDDDAVRSICIARDSRNSHVVAKHWQRSGYKSREINALKEKTAKLGAPKIDGTEEVGGKKAPELYFGTTKMNNNFAVVDEVAKEGGRGMAAATANQTSTPWSRDGLLMRTRCLASPPIRPPPGRLTRCIALMCKACRQHMRPRWPRNG